ncbi:hypothetical protein ES705_49558 [subsurface metagenome]
MLYPNLATGVRVKYPLLPYPTLNNPYPALAYTVVPFKDILVAELVSGVSIK